MLFRHALLVIPQASDLFMMSLTKKVLW